MNVAWWNKKLISNKISDFKPKEAKPLEKPGQRWEDNIKQKLSAHAATIFKTSIPQVNYHIP